MTNERRSELLDSFKVIQGASVQDWLDFIEGNERIPYLIYNEAEKMERAVRILCPPGFEIDR